MAVVIPFKGLHYNAELLKSEAEKLLAPPYDVVDASLRDRIASLSPYNIFNLELPKGDGDKYQRAAALLEQWKSSGVLVQEEQCAVYPYTIRFEHQGVFLKRQGFIGLVRLEAWESRIIRPHEQTFAQVTSDRLSLFKATRAQFSQVFLLYRRNEDAKKILAEAPRESLVEVKDSLGNQHVVERITEPEALRELTRAFKDRVMYIADGHHRYTTALAYKKLMEEMGSTPISGSNFLMAYFVDTSDKGLIVLPTHRVFKLPSDLAWQEILTKAEKYFDFEGLELPETGSADALASLIESRLENARGRHGFGVVARDYASIWWLKEGACSLKKEHALELAKLDVVVLRKCVVETLLGIEPGNLKAGENVRYEPDGVKALKGLGKDEVLFYLRPTPVEQVLDVSDAGLTLPHKSTFFYPKILTGLVLNDLSKDAPELIRDLI